jgi:DNA processing protein
MTEQDLFYLLALQRVEGVGDIMAKKLLTHCGSAEAVLKQRPLNLLPLMRVVRCYLET